MAGATAIPSARRSPEVSDNTAAGRRTLPPSGYTTGCWPVTSDEQKVAMHPHLCDLLPGQVQERTILVLSDYRLEGRDASTSA
jgi:hypothetical protein